MLKKLTQFNPAEIEEKVLTFWEKNKIFEKSVALRTGKKPFRFFEGPPTANGLPGVHHALARAFKDIILRYQTMRGRFVLRRAGWDTHGLPVEIAVEKELGIKQKSEIEKLGIAEFNQRARLSVWRYKAEWERFTKRLGFWLDFDHPYITYENSYIETLWWILKETDRRRLLTKLHKVIPWCTRCQTPLSNNELGQPGVYQKVKDPSLYLKLPLRRSLTKKHGREYLLVWTTTPWTLPGNAAVAVNPNVAYTKFKVGDEFLWSLTPPPHPLGSPEPVIAEKVAGTKLVGLRYVPAYPGNPQLFRNAYRILAADFVSTEEGTGFVHISPAFGDDDFKLIHAENQKLSREQIPVLVTVDDRGRMKSGFPGAGKFLKEADRDVLADLARRGFLFREDVIEHEYPFCWRCQTPLIYLARLTWFIEMGKLKQDLIRANKTVNWIPGHIKEGRFGEWLKEGKDWCISRERYWGTPLPIWEGEKCDHRFVAGSFEDLNTYRYRENRFFVVRHGEAEHNVKKTLACMPEGKHPPRLTKKGRAQIALVGEKLEKENIDFIITSPNRRARESAQVIARATGAKVFVDKRLREIEFGTFNGGSESRYQAFFASFAERFSKRPPSGENWADVRKRVTEAITEIDRKMSGKRIVIVSHGDPLWLLEGATKNIPELEMAKVPYIELGQSREISIPNWPFSREGLVDFHRPFVDEVSLRCPECGGKMRRVKEVADVWFDSGSMPFASWHYPFENREAIDRGRQFPADYIVEGVDQTRGWFYTLLEVSTLLGKGASYRNVISTGLVFDKHGQKMSKSKGNVVDPMAVIRAYGADTLRWYFYTVNDPADPKQFDEEDVKKTLRRAFMILWNTYLFLETYRGERHTPNGTLDRWIEARLRETAKLVTTHLDAFAIGEAARAIEALINDLSRWYVRRSRKNVSPQVLEDILIQLAKLMAPFAPFFAEALYQSLKTQNSKLKTQSVHLEDWLFEKPSVADRRLIASMAEIRRLANLALAAREKAGIKIRQPLNLLKLKTKNLKLKTDTALLQLLKDEVNVKAVTFASKLKTEVELDTVITPELFEEGMVRELTRMVQQLRQDAGLNFKDTIMLRVEASREVVGVFEKHAKGIQEATNTRAAEVALWGSGENGKFDAELESKLNEQPIKLKLRKIK